MTPEHRPGRRGSARQREALRGLHNQTWELELLISGTVAIVLAFLPSRVDELFFSTTAQTSGALDQIAFLAFYFTKLTLYTLIFTFAVHIVVRAFWVALVGLDSVFPRGPRWSELKLGPFSRRVYRTELPSVRELIVASDAVASVTFAAAFTLVAIFVVSIPWAIGFGGVAAVAVRVLGLDISVSAALAVGTGIGAAVVTLPFLIDRARGEKLEEAGRGRILERALRLSARIAGLRVYGPVQYTLASNVGSRTFSVGVFGFMVVVISVFLVKDGFTATGAVSFAADAYHPVRAGALEVDPRLYEQGDPTGRRRMLVPSLPAPVLDPETPYLRIFAPLLPESDTEALARVCPGLAEVSSVGVSLKRMPGRAPAEADVPGIAEALRCRAALWEVSVDGRPVDAEPRFWTREYDGVVGLAWLVDVRDLEPGEHVVDVRRSQASLDPDDPPEEDDLPRAYRMPVWN